MSVGMVVNPHLVLKYTNMYVKWALNHFVFLEWHFSNLIVLLRARCQYVFDIIREMEEHYTLWGLQRMHYVSATRLYASGLFASDCRSNRHDILQLIYIYADFPALQLKEKHSSSPQTCILLVGVMLREQKGLYVQGNGNCQSDYDTARRKRVRVSLVKHFKNNLSLHSV